MADEPNSSLAVVESPAGNDAGLAPESPLAVTASPSTEANWQKQAEGLSDEDLMDFLEKHPKGAAIKERLGQSHADKVLLKDRREIELRVRREIADQAWQEKWASLTPQERVNYRVQKEELDMVKGQVVSDWWPAQALTLKEHVPELKKRDLTAFNKVFEEHPDSLGDTMAAFIHEVSDMRNEAFRKDFMERELPKFVEAEVKTRLGKTLASEDGPDLLSSGPSSAMSEEDHFKAYGRGKSEDHARAQKYMKSIGL